MSDKEISTEQILDKIYKEIASKTEEFRKKLDKDTELQPEVKHDMLQHFSRALIEFEFNALREFRYLGINQFHKD